LAAPILVTGSAPPNSSPESFTGIARFQATANTAATGAISLPASTPSPRLTVKQFAALQQVSVRTVKGWQQRGLPVHKCGTRIVRIDAAEANAWLERSQPATNAAAAAERLAARIVEHDRKSGRRVA
jgi:hypothetical protein